MTNILLVYLQVNITGTMHFWGLTIDTVTTIILVLAVGLSVDYASHVAHTFMILPGTRYRKSKSEVILSPDLSHFSVEQSVVWVRDKVEGSLSSQLENSVTFLA